MQPTDQPRKADDLRTGWISQRSVSGNIDRFGGPGIGIDFTFLRSGTLANGRWRKGSHLSATVSGQGGGHGHTPEHVAFVGDWRDWPPENATLQNKNFRRRLAIGRRPGLAQAARRSVDAAQPHHAQTVDLNTAAGSKHQTRRINWPTKGKSLIASSSLKCLLPSCGGIKPSAL